jgi:heat shock protein HslJ
MFQLEGNDQSLRMLDREGKFIQSDLNFSLARRSIFQPMKPELVLRGLFRYSADVVSFEPCATGQKMLVIMDGDYLALESAYVAAHGKPGEPLLAEINARVLKQVRMEGEGAEPAVLVKHFIALSNENSCPPAKPAQLDSVANIENHTWILTALGGAPVKPKAGKQAAQLLLDAKEKRVSGSGGCNRIAGGYTMDGSKLSFGQMVSTMMMCADGAEQEQRFIKALAEVATWEIHGDVLTLHDQAGKNLADFRVGH